MEPFQAIATLRSNIETVFQGKADKVELLLICLLASGHALLEDVPGVGKTTLAKSLALSLDAQFQRVQFTPDLLPSDVLGVSIYQQEKSSFQFLPGPIFTNILLADEINRTTPRTQSSLLEAMSELQVTIDGTTYPLPQPFMVVATQNPFESEGTYPLPESQLDRFLIRFRLGYPNREEERAILLSQAQQNPLETLKPVLTRDFLLQIQKKVREISLSPILTDYLLELADRTRQSEKIQVGVSPRGVLLLTRAAKARAFLYQRDYCIPDDIKALLLPVWSHRILVKSSLSQKNSFHEEQILSQLIQSVPVPV